MLMKSLYFRLLPRLVFKWRFNHFWPAANSFGRTTNVSFAMSLLAEQQMTAGLGDRLRDASAITVELMSDIIRGSCRRFPSQGQRGKCARVEELVRLGAWTEAALALLDLELPQWQIRRLAYDGGEWYCSLSRERELPDWLDQSIETHHTDLAVAILSAFVEAQRITAPASRPSVPSVTRQANVLYQPICSENFS
jgi:hypothetical protein